MLISEIIITYPKARSIFKKKEALKRLLAAQSTLLLRTKKTLKPSHIISNLDRDDHEREILLRHLNGDPKKKRS